MFALVFRSPVGRYHATPWGRNVNEADIAWPPEPWRLLRTLIATYWRKGDRERWSEGSLADLIDMLAGTLPVYHLPKGAVHAHTRHYMPFVEGKQQKTTLVFDAFVRLPKQGQIVAAWPEVILDADLFAFAADLAAAIGYLGRAESWMECEALAEWDGEVNCRPVGTGFSGDPVRLLTPLQPAMYATERERLIADEEERIRAAAKKPPSPKKLEEEVEKAFQSKGGGMNTLPKRLVDALTLDTTDYQDRGWSRPPAAHEVIYDREKEVAAGVASRIPSVTRRRGSDSVPTVARFLLAGRPRPRVEDTVKIGEAMRRAALSQFGWCKNAAGRKIPKAPAQISGHDADGKPLKDPSHTHAFWLPEDADSDGLIDHISVFIANGIDDKIQTKLDRITRIWLSSRQRVEGGEIKNAKDIEWRLALEGFGRPEDFADSSRINSSRVMGTSTEWQSVTPFMAAGHLKATGYQGEVIRLIKKRKINMNTDTQFSFDAADISVIELPDGIHIGDAERHKLHFHRFRSRGQGHEAQYDATGAFLKIVFPKPIKGPLALGYGSHFGLGLFAAVD